MPSSAEITAELREQIVRDRGVAMATASKALAGLRQLGLTETVTGVGTVVAKSGRRRRPGRSAEPAGPAELQDRIVRAATTIADAEGLPATTMRRIATELNVATMVLYRHVRGKDHLVTLMADAAFGEHRPPARTGGDWRAQLELLCRTQWTMYRQHPWLAHAVSFTRPLLAPHAIAHTEWAMRAVAGHGLDAGTLLHIAATVANFVRGTAVNLEREAEAEQDTGLTDDEWLRTQGETLAATLRTGSFPILAGISTRTDIDLTLDTLFEFGLQRMLDGITPLMAVIGR